MSDVKIRTYVFVIQAGLGIPPWSCEARFYRSADAFQRADQYMQDLAMVPSIRSIAVFDKDTSDLIATVSAKITTSLRIVTDEERKVAKIKNEGIEGAI